MNTLQVEDIPTAIDIFWVCEQDTIQIVNDSEFTKLDFGCKYGPYCFHVYAQDSLIGTFYTINTDRKRSYDWKFTFHGNDVILSVDPIMRITSEIEL